MIGFNNIDRKILFSAAFIICICSVHPDERRTRDWTCQIAKFMRPISTNVSAKCRIDTSEYLDATKNISNFWAISMMDATAKFPSGILSGNIRALGSFDQCLRIQHPADKYGGKYCLTRLQYSTYGPDKAVLQNYVDHVTAGRRLLELGDDWVKGTLILPTYSCSEFAVCLPSTCSADDIAIITKDAIQRATVDIGLQVTVTLDEDFCYTAASRSKPFNSVDHFFTFLVVTLLVITIVGSASCQLFNVKEWNGFFPKILRAFSVGDNWRKLTESDPPSNNMITCLEGIRTLSTGWVVITHQIMLISQEAYINKLETMQTHNDYVYYAMWNSYFNVDSFLLVSGLLRAYNLTKELSQSRVNLLKSGLQRYLRLTPAYLFVILFYMSYFHRLDSGPSWNLYISKNAEVCKKYWWQNLLYMNNYIPDNDKCLLQSWYLSADMQLFLVAPLLVYPLWRWKMIGKLLITVSIIISVVAPFITTWINQFPGTYMFNIRNSVLSSYAHNLYMATHNRMSPYFVGLVLGYILHSKKSLVLAKWQVAGGWIASLSVMYACVYGAKNMTSFQHVHNTLESALYGGLHRFAWAVAIAWVIYACHFGYGGVVNKFLSCNAFKFLGRISYSVFLTHLAVLLYNAAVIQVPRQLHTYVSIRDFMGDFCFIFIASLPLHIFVELPLHDVTKHIFKK